MKKLKRLFNTVWQFLEGKKSFIGALVIFVAGGLKALGKIDDKTFQWIVTIGGAISVYGLRQALKEMEK